ncbi:nuclease, partial [Arthrospira sp. O9.13F]
MLDLTQLARQMQGMSKHLTREAQAASDRLQAAQNLLTEAQKHQEELIESLNYWVDRIPFHPAIPIDQLDSCFTIQAPPAAHTVFATDGSQIAPNAHEIAYCYLINIGRVVLYYGQSRHPILDSVPEIFYRPEDLYISRQWGVRTEE